jgi:hypothetical protein
MNIHLRAAARSVWTVAALLALLAGGCAFKGDKPAGSGGSGVGEDGLIAATNPAGGVASNGEKAWQVKPVRMRVYPSTRFVRDKGAALLEARVELLDDAGDPVKGVGDFRFDLFGAGRAGEPTMGQRLYSWDVSMLSLDANRQHYEITRTYLFRLKLDDLSVTQSPVRLLVTFMPAGGGRLETRALIGPEGVTSGDNVDETP